MGIADVRGNFTFGVYVDCPWCNRRSNLNNAPYTDELLGIALFGSADKPAKWDNMNLEYQCRFCSKHFILIQVY